MNVKKKSIAERKENRYISEQPPLSKSITLRYSSRQMDTYSRHSHAHCQVPDLHSPFVDGSKHSRPHGGPLDVMHGPLGRGEAQHGRAAVLLPQLDSPVGGAAQEGARTEGRPLNLIDGTLGGDGWVGGWDIEQVTLSNARGLLCSLPCTEPTHSLLTLCPW